MTTTVSGTWGSWVAGGLSSPAVTSKNYMPSAKVLALHYSNIKSSWSGKSTRVAVCNFSLASLAAFHPAAAPDPDLVLNFSTV